MRHLLASLALLSALALSCATTCDEPTASGDADLDAEDDGDACRLRCGDYGSCSERLPYCCKGICQAEPCK